MRPSALQPSAALAFPWRELIIVMTLAAGGRALLLASGTVSFHSDEAIVGLMARHINQGAQPVFFYGQAYMGTLDSWLVAAAFRLFGESVLSIRIVQSTLYLLTTLTIFMIGWRVSHRRAVALAAGIICALPPALFSVYTTASLGGYGEVLLLGGLVILLAAEVLETSQTSRVRWLLLGLCAGLGWWVNGLIIVYLLPVAALVLLKLARARRRALLIGAILAAIGFIAGSAPWWVYDFTHDHAALGLYLGAVQSDQYGGQSITLADRLIGMLLFGIPAATGLRFPWSTDYFLLPWGIAVLMIIVIAYYRLLCTRSITPAGRTLLAGVAGAFVLVFLASSFGADPTGRFFLPLLLPTSVALGILVDEVLTAARDQRQRLAAWALILFTVGYWAGGTVAAASSPPGLTTQFTTESHIPNEYDEALLYFLSDNGLYHGYTNYWVAFRIAFLSGERLQYSPALPYRADLVYNPRDDRYPPYTQATRQADRIAWITANLPTLDDKLRTLLAETATTYESRTIGPYTIYYGFDPPHPLPWQNAVDSASGL